MSMVDSSIIAIMEILSLNRYGRTGALPFISTTLEMVKAYRKVHVADCRDVLFLVFIALTMP